MHKRVCVCVSGCVSVCACVFVFEHVCVTVYRICVRVIVRVYVVRRKLHRSDNPKLVPNYTGSVLKQSKCSGRK